MKVNLKDRGRKAKVPNKINENKLRKKQHISISYEDAQPT
jgi:hypothetical protein